MPELGEDGRVANAMPLMPAPTAQQQARLGELEGSIAKLTRQAEARQKAWRWRKSEASRVLALARQSAAPAGAALDLPCETAGDFTLAADGIDGTACTITATASVEKTVPISRRDPLTFSAWISLADGDTDAPLLSAIDYARNAASVSYGAGTEIRLVDGELEFRSGQRFPAYSMRVRSQGAALTPGQWRHVAMLYEGRLIWQGDVGAIDHSNNEYVDQFVHGRAEGPITAGVR